MCLIVHLVHLEVSRLDISDITKCNCTYLLDYLLSHFMYISNYASSCNLTCSSEMRLTNFQIVWFLLMFDKPLKPLENMFFLNPLIETDVFLLLWNNTTNFQELFQKMWTVEKWIALEKISQNYKNGFLKLLIFITIRFLCIINSFTNSFYKIYWVLVCQGPVLGTMINLIRHDLCSCGVSQCLYSTREYRQ